MAKYTDKSEILKRVNMSHGLDVKYTSEYLFRLQKIAEVYKKTLDSYINDLKNKKASGLKYIHKKLINHINNKIRVDAGGNMFLQLPDKSKWYGDLTEYQHFMEEEGKHQLLSKILDEFESVLSGDWEEYGKPFLYDDAGSASTEEPIETKKDIVNFLTNVCRVSTNQLQHALVWFKNRQIEPDHFVDIIRHIYKVGDDSIVKFEFDTDKSIKFILDGNGRSVIRKITTDVIELIDFNSVNPISFTDYKQLSLHETRYFVKLSNKSIKKKIVKTELGYVYPFILLDYQFVNKEQNDKLLADFLYWMESNVGVTLDPEFYVTLQLCAKIKFYDKEKDKNHYFFSDFINTIIDPKQTVILEYNINGEN